MLKSIVCCLIAVSLGGNESVAGVCGVVCLGGRGGSERGGGGGGGGASEWVGVRG